MSPYALVRTSVIVFLLAFVLDAGTSQSAFGADRAVRDVQQKLTDLGYNPGPSDGLFGSKTRAALMQYQEDNSLPKTGQIDKATAKALGVEILTPKKKEKYGPLPPELSCSVKTDSVFFTDGGRKILGTLKSLNCEGQEIELASPEIQNGFVHTARYGKIMISPPPNMWTPILPLSITPSQKKELLKLKKSR